MFTFLSLSRWPHIPLNSTQDLPNTPVHSILVTVTSYMRPKILFGSGCLFSSMSVINYLISTSILRPVAWGTFYTIGNYAKIIEFLNIFFYSSFNRMECLHFLDYPTYQLAIQCGPCTWQIMLIAYVYLFLIL